MPIDYQKSADYKRKVDDLDPEPFHEDGSWISPKTWLDPHLWEIDEETSIELGLRNQITYSAVYRKTGAQYRCTITATLTATKDVLDDVRIYDPDIPLDRQTRLHRVLLERAQRDTPGAIGQTRERGVRDRGR